MVVAIGMIIWFYSGYLGFSDLIRIKLPSYLPSDWIPETLAIPDLMHLFFLVQGRLLD